MERCILWNFCKNDGLCELQGDSGPHSGYDMGAGCMNATRSVGSLRLARQRHESDSTQEMRRFTYSKIIAVQFNSPNIHRWDCTWMHQFIRSNLSGFCPLEVEFAIFCPELCPGHCTRLEKPTAASAHAQCVMGYLQCEKQIVSMRGCNCIAQILNQIANWTNDCCF